MADWLDEFRRKEQEQKVRLAKNAAREQAEVEIKQAREDNYLKNKARIDAKISEIESYANEVRDLTKAGITTQIEKGVIYVRSSNIGGGITFRFQDKDVDVHFWQGGYDEYAGYDTSVRGSVRLNINDITTKKISRWFQWLAQQGGKLPVTLKSDSDRKTDRILAIIGIALLLFVLTGLIISLIEKYISSSG